MMARDCQTLLRFSRSAHRIAFQPKQFSEWMQGVKIVFYDQNRPHSTRVLTMLKTRAGKRYVRFFLSVEALFSNGFIIHSARWLCNGFPGCVTPLATISGEALVLT